MAYAKVHTDKFYDTTINGNLTVTGDAAVTGSLTLEGYLSMSSGQSIKVGTTAIMDLATTYINILKTLYVRANLGFPTGGILTLGADLASAGFALQNANHLELDEITTPTAVPDHGKVYTKADNKLYFQDGAGLEHEVAFV